MTGDPGAVREMLEWEIVPEDWWKTSFRAISWSFKTKPGYPRPPHYHNLLARGRRRRITVDTHPPEEDVDLNDGLSGVRAAQEALERYEVEVSILSPDDLEGHDLPAHRCLTALGKENWDEKVRELLGGILQPGSLPEVEAPSPDDPLWDLNRLDTLSPPPGTPSTAAFTDSDNSVDSEPLPSTPKPNKASYARVVSSETPTSPTVLSPLPSKLLSAAALTFIPSTPNGPSIREAVTPPLTAASNSSGDSPFSSPTYNFHFPALVTFAQCCPKLSSLTLPSLDFSSIRLMTDFPLVPRHPLKHLSVSVAICGHTSPVQITVALDRLCPELDVDRLRVTCAHSSGTAGSVTSDLAFQAHIRENLEALQSARKREKMHVKLLEAEAA